MHRSTYLRRCGVNCYRPSIVVCRSVCRSVCILSVTVVSLAKTAKPIDWIRDSGGPRPRNHVLDGGPDPPTRRGSFKGIGRGGRCNVQRLSDCDELWRNGWTDWDAVLDLDSVGSRKHVLGGGAHWRHMANTTEPSMCGGDVACCQITLMTCYYLIIIMI